MKAAVVEVFGTRAAGREVRRRDLIWIAEAADEVVRVVET
jgi:hypothetical protein